MVVVEDALVHGEGSLGYSNAPAHCGHQGPDNQLPVVNDVVEARKLLPLRSVGPVQQIQLVDEFGKYAAVFVEVVEPICDKEAADGQGKLLGENLNGQGEQVEEQVDEQGDKVHEWTGGDEEIDDF